MDLKTLYGDNADLTALTARINALEKRFETLEGAKPEHLFSSSGRAEILGNHTDHNHGLVMVAAISCDILAAVSIRSDGIVKIIADDYPPVEVDITDLEIKPEEFGTSNALTRGVAKGIIDRGYKIKGFTAYTTSNIFKGAGVSSSAAFEVLVAEIFNSLYLNGKLTAVDRAVISQYAENVYFNKPCGILDQSGISIGSLVKLDFNEPTKPVIEKIDPPAGYTLVITNTGGDHADLTDHYAAIRKEMEAVANYFGKKVLRDVEYSEFIEHVPALKRHFSGRAIMRAMHFYAENDRVIAARDALKSNNVKDFLKNVNESGLSSLILLQNCCVPGDVQQPVVLGIEYSRRIIKDGAVRVHGGGFAGSILAFVKDEEVSDYVRDMSKLFGAENVFEANVRRVGTVRIY